MLWARKSTLQIAVSQISIVSAIPQRRVVLNEKERSALTLALAVAWLTVRTARDAVRRRKAVDFRASTSPIKNKELGNTWT